MAKNTDEIATQLAVLKYVQIFDIDGAVADMAQESAIEGVVEQERAKAAERAATPSVSNAGETVIGNDASVIGNETQVKFSIANTLDMSWEDQLRKSKRSDTLVASKNTPSYLTERGVSDKPLAIPKSIITKAQSGKDESHSISDDNVKKLSYGIENAIAVVDDRDRNSLFYITNLNENGKPITVAFAKDMDFDGDKVHAARSIHIREDIGAYLNGLNNATIYVKNKNEFDNLSRNADNLDRVQEKIELIDNSISQPEPVVNTSDEKNVVKHDLAESGNDGKAAEKSSESKNKSAESKKSEAKSGEPKISEAKESLTDEQRAERAKKQAEAWIEWEKKTAPTAKELNKARECVKGFDNLDNNRRLAIIRLIRSADGVKSEIVKGIANIMAVNPKSDLEFRFAEGIGNKGLTTHIGNKTVIVINSKADTVAALRGTIAHELLHYLETREGYKDFADYVMSKAKPEAIERHRNRYVAGYEKLGIEYTKAELDSEIAASLLGDALQSERFLKRYAERDKSFIQKAAGWVRELASKLKKKNETAEQKAAAKDAIKVADEYAQIMNVILQQKTVKKATGGVKYSVAGTENEEINSIKEQLKKSNDTLASMTPIKSKEPPRTFKNAKEAVEWAVEVLRSSGELIQRKGYGEVVLDEKRLKNGLSYLKTDMEKVAFSLVPKVIKNGIEIGRHSKHKDRIYDTVTFASPVTVGDITGYMAVVIREEGKNYFKLHRVFMPDGSLFEFQETKRSNAETAGLHNANLSPTNVASNNSISQKSDLSTPSAKKYDLADEVTEAPKKKAKTKAEVVAENKELRAENRELKASQQATQNKMRGMLERLAREEAEYQKRANAEVFAKEDVALAVKSIESWTQEEALSLAKGFDLKGMTKAKREEMISQIYIALHEQSARGESGPGSVAVKILATKIAAEYIDSAAIRGEDGKVYHLLPQIITNKKIILKSLEKSKKLCYNNNV